MAITFTDMKAVLNVAFSAALTAIIWRVLSRLYFHPLARYPGPKLAAISNLPYVRWAISGQLHQKIRELHDQYGEVVRIRPNALTYRSPQAWKDIYGHRKQGTLPFSKDPEFFMPSPPGQSHIVNSDEVNHTRQKRLLTHAFSERAMREQEPLIMSYVDQFIEQLRGCSRSGEPVNLEKWLNFLTFDIVGDLAFGEPFGCLRDSEYHPWVATIFQSIKTGASLRALSVYPRLAKAVRSILPKKTVCKRVQHYQMSKEKVVRRLAAQTQRPDFISHIVRCKAGDEREMRQAEIEANAAILIQAGSETTATALAACLYYLHQCPDSHRRVTDEVRAAFPSESSITFASVRNLPFLDAIIEEGLRLFPPLPAILPRLVPQGGAIIDGSFVPAGVSVSVAHYSANRGSSNFVDPDSFLPERWLEKQSPDEAVRFERDQREACQSFSYGPRACIGRNLAYAEMRTILAKLLWNFDTALLPQSNQWDNAKSYIVWEKHALWFRLQERSNHGIGV